MGTSSIASIFAADGKPLSSAEGTSSDLLSSPSGAQSCFLDDAFALRLSCPLRHFCLLLPVFECFPLLCTSAVHKRCAAPLCKHLQVAEKLWLHLPLLPLASLDEMFCVLCVRACLCAFKVPHLPLHGAMSPLRLFHPTSFHSSSSALSCSPLHPFIYTSLSPTYIPLSPVAQN